MQNSRAQCWQVTTTQLRWGRPDLRVEPADMSVLAVSDQKPLASASQAHRCADTDLQACAAQLEFDLTGLAAVLQSLLGFFLLKLFLLQQMQTMALVPIRNYNRRTPGGAHALIVLQQPWRAQVVLPQAGFWQAPPDAAPPQPGQPSMPHHAQESPPHRACPPARVLHDLRAPH